LCLSHVCTFFLISQAPLEAKSNSSRSCLNVKELTNQAYSERNFYSNVKTADGKYLAASFTFRGKIATQDVDEQINQIQTKQSEDFVEWIPNNLKSSLIQRPPTTSLMSCTFVANTTSLKAIFQRLAQQFGAMYRRKAFLHWYKGEGMDEMEFQEADKNVRDLITEYQDKQEATYEEEEEEVDDEECESI